MKAGLVDALERIAVGIRGGETSRVDVDLWLSQALTAPPFEPTGALARWNSRKRPIDMPLGTTYALWRAACFECQAYDAWEAGRYRAMHGFLTRSWLLLHDVARREERQDAATIAQLGQVA